MKIETTWHTHPSYPFAWWVVTTKRDDRGKRYATVSLLDRDIFDPSSRTDLDGVASAFGARIRNWEAAEDLGVDMKPLMVQVDQKALRAEIGG